jgi:hypothetical protein
MCIKSRGSDGCCVLSEPGDDALGEPDWSLSLMEPAMNWPSLM